MMKKIMNYAILSAIAFTGAIGFSSCSDENVVAENNPNYNPETGEVSTEFVFNVATSNTPTTRMSAQDTQAEVTSASQFRGIANAMLLTFKLGTDNDGNHISTPLVADKTYNFGTVLGAGTLDPGGDGTSIPKSRRVVQISLPTETNAMIFYGKAPKTGTNNSQGKVLWNPAPDGKLADDEASLCRIVPETAYEESPNKTEAALLQYENLMANVLSEIVNSTSDKDQLTYTYGSESVTLTQPVKWSDYVDVTGTDSKKLVKKTTDVVGTGNMCALGEILGNEFLTLNTIYDGELRAGSGSSIAYMMKELVATINSVATAIPFSLQETVAKAVAEGILANIQKYFDKDNGYVWLSTSTVKTAMTKVLDKEKNLVDASSDLNVFPTDFELPLGSVILQFLINGNSTDGFEFKYAYKGTVETYAMGGSANDGFNPLNYTYPAELCYFGNSPIRVTNETVATKNYPDGVTDWNNDSKWTAYNWTKNSHVLSTTQSVAMQYNIQYGTALLKTQVRYGAQILEDNVGWNYLAKASNPGFGSMVYDNVGTIDIPKATATAGGNPSDPVYTLLWDNWQESTTGKQRTVYVALEFKNNSKGFWGKNNFIPEGGTFYIVGKLDPDAIVGAQGGGESNADYYAKGITWPTNQALPPYDANGETIKQRRVFIQDFMTTATFVIGDKSLQEALVAVPDLRSGQLSLGLSVDLQWETGLNFDNVILGQQ